MLEHLSLCVGESSESYEAQSVLGGLVVQSGVDSWILGMVGALIWYSALYF